MLYQFITTVGGSYDAFRNYARYIQEQLKLDNSWLTNIINNLKMVEEYAYMPKDLLQRFFRREGTVEYMYISKIVSSLFKAITGLELHDFIAIKSFYNINILKKIKSHIDQYTKIMIQKYDCIPYPEICFNIYTKFSKTYDYFYTDFSLYICATKQVISFNNFTSIYKDENSDNKITINVNKKYQLISNISFNEEFAFPGINPIYIEKDLMFL